MKKNRIAVCVSGHLRMLEEGINNFYEHVINPNDTYEFDFFIDSWFKNDWRCEDNKTIDNETLKLLNRLNLKSLRFECDHNWDTTKFLNYIKPGYVKKGTNGEHILAMFYKINMCDLSVQEYEKLNCFKYDIVIRWRTDIGFEHDLLFPKFNNVLDTFVMIPITNVLDDDWVTDVFAFSSSINMHLYSRLHTVMSQRVEELGKFRPELLLMHHLKRENLSVLKVPLSWKVLRN